MSYLHITNQTEDSADLNLFSRIVDGAGQSFINEFQFLDSLELKQINVRINSKGGDVFEGFGIISAIRNAKTHIVTINEGIAASMGGMILVAGDERKAVDFSQTMTHNPSINGESSSEETKNMLSNIKDSLIKIFTNNTGLKKEKVDELMNNTTFMSAKEALKNGIIDEIISTKRKIKNTMAPDELYNLVLNNFETKPKINKMKTLTDYFNLNEDTSEDAVLNLIKTNESEAADKISNEETAHKETKTELEKVQNELKELKAANVEQTVDNAITAGKISKDDRDKMITVATETPDAFNTIIDSVKEVRTTLESTIDNSQESIDETKKDWTIRDYEKKDPVALNEMRLNDFENYSKLFEDTYKSKPKK